MNLKKHFFIIILSFILTAIFTWPFISKLDTFFYDDGEYQLSASIMAYNSSSISSGKIFNRKEYFNGFQLYPQPYTLAYSDLRLLPSIIFMPIFIFLKTLIPQVQAYIFSVNLVTLLAFVLSFITSFYAIHYLVKNPLAVLVGAVVYTFNPITFSKMPEHFEYLNKYLLPLVFLFGFKLFKDPTLKNSLIFFLVLTLNAFSTIYYQIYTFILLPFFTLPFLISSFLKKDKKYFLKLIFCSLIFIIFVPIFIYFNSPYLEFSKKENATRSLLENSLFSARLIDYVSAPPNNWVYNSFVKSIVEFRAPKGNNGEFNYLEHSLFLNIIPLVLFCFFLWYFFKNQGFRRKDNFVFLSFGVLLVVSFVLTFGPFFQGWNSSDSQIKSPFYFLYQNLPLLKGVRVPTRAQFLFYVPFSLFISFGLSYLLSKVSMRSKKLPYFLVIIILLGLFVENFTPSAIGRPYSSTSSMLATINKINSEGKSLDFLKGKVVLHLPTSVKDPGKTGGFLNWTALTGEKMVNGNWGSFPVSSQVQLLLGLDKKLDEESLKSLKVLDVNFIIFHKNLLEDKKQIYEKFVDSYQNSIVYDSNNILIIDISKLNLKYNQCNFESDIDISIQKAMIPSLIQDIYIVQVKNKSDCYLPQKYMEKYKEITVYQKDLFGNRVKKIFYLNLPPVIPPVSKFLLSEINNELRVE